MSNFGKQIFLICAIFTPTVYGQAKSNEPHIGYLYPAGAQQGTVVTITVGGQLLRGVTNVHISGGGVHGSVVKYIRPVRNIQREQRELLQERMKEIRDRRLSEMSGGSSNSYVRALRLSEEKAKAKSETSKNEDADKKEQVKLPDHPLLFGLEDKSIRELAHIVDMLFFPRTKLQMNRQIAETVLIEITIAPDAEPGSRELRLGTKTALTNPVVFQVGVVPEVLELEPNNEKAYEDLPRLLKVPNLPGEKAHELPVLFNGQIMPGDVDRFRFRASRGQKLVIEAHARSLIPYLADAVPGWFQATLALYDAVGRELAFADDYRFNPDPVLFYEVPRDAEYELEIRDSIYRGREDFVYRISISERPFITQVFPLGGREAAGTEAEISGWNLPGNRIPLDTRPGGDCIRQTVYSKAKQVSNPVTYAVDTLPGCLEAESNDTIRTAQRIALPKIINGRIDRSGDIDVFRISGRAGDEVAAEIYARRLNSPLDSLLRLTDAAGNVLELNDDYVLKESHLHKNMAGLLTHHADSYLLAKLPKDGTYYVHLADSQNHGGDAYGYRLRISAPQKDFSLRVTPSNVSVQAGGIVPINVHALRKDGFEGEIEIVLKDSSAGFKIGGGRIPAGRDSVRMTLTAPAKTLGRPVALQLEGRARTDGRIISRPVLGADDVMQAFLYRHLVPAKEFIVMVQKSRWRAPSVELVGDYPVRIPAGGSAEVSIKTRRSSVLKELKLELDKPPEGLTIDEVNVKSDGLAFRLKVEKDAFKDDFADNLIVEAFREYRPKQKDGKLSAKKRRYSMGIFPAIPIQVVAAKEP
jgi:hypothetical protein